MKVAPIPRNEALRQAELDAYGIVDTPPEDGFDDITRLASMITEKPIALVSLVDGNRQWFKSKVGLDAEQTGRDISFCGHAICGSELFVIENALEHPDFCDNPLTLNAPHVVFYAGVPLTSPRGHNMGTLCVIDSKAGQLSSEQADALQRLARQVVAQMELRKQAFMLRETIAELEVANEAKATFIANLSHEIRTPLNAIVGTLQVIEDKRGDDSQTEMLAMARLASKTVLTLVNDVLDMAKINAGRFELTPVPGDLVEFGRRALGMFGSQAQLKKIQLKYVPPKVALPPVCFDPVRLQQVLMNLIGNAIKFTPESGRVSLTVSTEAVEDERVVVQLCVADTGMGMAPETLLRLGRPFEQADTSVHKNYGGTGLGLAISKRLVELAGGRLSFDSQLGEGTQVTVVLPLIKAEFSTTKKEEPRSDLPCPRSILIVDDVTMNRTVLRKMLQRWGISACEADGGLSALQSFRAERPQVVLLDLQMPDMDGYEVLRNMREFEAQNDQTPAFVVAVTGQAYDDDIRRCQREGFDAHLAKPVDMEALRQLLLSAS